MKKFATVAVSFTLLLVLVLFALNYFWQNRHQYFFKGDQPYELRQEESSKEDAEPWSLLEQAPQDDNEEQEEESQEEEEERPVQEYEPPEIEKEDCDSRCEDYEDDDLLYCKEICGLSEREVEGKVEDEQEDEGDEKDKCLKKEGFERDSCYKWRAIEEKNVGLCNKISDKELAQNCENRVIEELIP